MSEVSYQYSFVLLLFALLRFFHQKRFALTKSNHNLNNMILPTHIMYIFSFSFNEVHLPCCHQGSRWLIFSIKQVVHGPFWAYIVKYRTLCLQMRVTLFFYIKVETVGKWKMYFFIYVYETVSYVLWIRNAR